MSFPNMVQFMNYCGLREDLYQEIYDDKLSVIKRFKKCQELVNLISKCYEFKKPEMT